MSEVLERNISAVATSSRISTPRIDKSDFTATSLAYWEVADITPAQIVQRAVGAKLMNIVVACQLNNEGPEALAAYADGFLGCVDLPDLDLSMSYNTTLAIDHIYPESQAERTKERLIMQLSEHELNPVVYKLDDDSRVIEFLADPSRLVCIFDEEGMQMLWRDGSESRSEVIKNAFLSFDKVSQKIALILHFSDRRKVVRQDDLSKYVVA